MREVLTVSLGRHANFANAHYWNFQDELAGVQAGVLGEVDHEVLFRVSETADGEATYVPRVVMMDTRGALGSLSRLGGTLYNESAPAAPGGGYQALSADALASAGVWGGGVHTILQDYVPQSGYLMSLSAMDSTMADEGQYAQDDDGGREGEDYGDDEDGSGAADEAAAADAERAAALPTADPEYARKVAQELQETVKYWSDYLKVHVHPRSLHTLERTNRCESFDRYAAGTEAFHTDRAIEDATDACRHFLEECDLLQGFQIFADTDTAWGGVAVELLEYLRDDYRATPIVTFATSEHGGFPGEPDPESASGEDGHADRERRRPLNAALSMANLAEHASLVVPVHSTAFAEASRQVRFPSIRDYNTSAVTAAAIETATLPYRLLSKHGRMSDITSVLTNSGERRPIPLCSLEMQAPLDWRKLVMDVEPSGPSHSEPFEVELASRYLTSLSDHHRQQDDGRCPAMVSLTPQYGELSQLLPKGAAWEDWNDDDLCDVYAVRGLDLRLRRGVAPVVPPTRPAERSFRYRNQCSTFVGGTLPLPLCFPPVLCNDEPVDERMPLAPTSSGAGSQALEPEPEPEPELEGTGAKETSQPLLQEAAVATRLTTGPAGLFSLVHASQQVVRETRVGHNPTMMAAVGGTVDGMEQLGEIEEVITSMRATLLGSLHIEDEDEQLSEDDY